MVPVGAIIGGVIAGVLGALGWAGISYGIGYEIGWVAWIIGGLVGLGVALGSRGSAGAATGGVAAVIAIASILGGKYLAVDWIIAKGPSDDDRREMIDLAMTDTDFVLSFIADEVLDEYRADGRPLNWPRGFEPEFPDSRHDYPTDVWSEAERRWIEMNSDERAHHYQTVRNSVEMNLTNWIAESRGEIAREGFFQSFGLLDIVFFGLAIVTAFKIGSTGMIGDAEA